MRSFVWPLDFGVGPQSIDIVAILDNRDSLVVGSHDNISTIFGNCNRVDVVVDNHWIRCRLIIRLIRYISA